MKYTIPFAEDSYPTPTKKIIPALRPGGIPWYPKSYHEKISGGEMPNNVITAEEPQKSIKTEIHSSSDTLMIKGIEPKEKCTQEVSSGKSVSSEYMMTIMSKYRSKLVPKSIVSINYIITFYRI